MKKTILFLFSVMLIICTSSFSVQAKPNPQKENLQSLLEQWNEAKAAKQKVLGPKILALDPNNVQVNCVMATFAKMNDKCKAIQYLQTVLKQGKDCKPSAIPFIEKNSEACHLGNNTKNTVSSSPTPVKHPQNHASHSNEILDQSDKNLDQLMDEWRSAKSTERKTLTPKILKLDPYNIEVNCVAATFHKINDKCLAYKHYKIVIDQGADCKPSAQPFIEKNAEECSNSIATDFPPKTSVKPHNTPQANKPHNIQEDNRPHNTPQAHDNSLEALLAKWKDAKPIERKTLGLQILELDPNNVEVNCTMATFVKMKDKCKAIQYYKTVLDQGKDCKPTVKNFVKTNIDSCK